MKENLGIWKHIDIEKCWYIECRYKWIALYRYVNGQKSVFLVNFEFMVSILSQVFGKACNNYCLLYMSSVSMFMHVTKKTFQKQSANQNTEE